MARKEEFFPVDTMGGRIQQLRDNKGYGRAYFHTLLFPTVDLNDNSRQKTVHNWESGKTYPDYDTLRKICVVLNCDANYLLTMQDTPRKETTDISSATGLSNNAADILCSTKSDPYYSALISGIIESKHFPALLENLESAAKCKESAHVKFVNEYADIMQELIHGLEKMSDTDLIAEYEPNSHLYLNDSSFDKTLSVLSEFAPNMTALNRNDAVKFYLQEAQHSFRQAAEDAI